MYNIKLITYKHTVVKQYKYPFVPVVGDSVLLSNATMFKVTARALDTDENNPTIVLFGTIITE